MEASKLYVLVVSLLTVLREFEEKNPGVEGATFSLLQEAKVLLKKYIE